MTFSILIKLVDLHFFFFTCYFVVRGVTVIIRQQ